MEAQVMDSRTPWSPELIWTLLSTKPNNWPAQPHQEEKLSRLIWAEHIKQKAKIQRQRVKNWRWYLAEDDRVLVGAFLAPLGEEGGHLPSPTLHLPITPSLLILHIHNALICLMNMLQLLWRCTDPHPKILNLSCLLRKKSSRRAESAGRKLCCGCC